MKSRNLTVVLLAVGLGLLAGFFSRPLLSGMAANNLAEEQTLTFESNVTSYSYSEKNVIGITKIDDRNYAIQALNPGMCVISFSTTNRRDVPQHVRRGRFIVAVSADRHLTIQETTLAADGML